MSVKRRKENRVLLINEYGIVKEMWNLEMWESVQDEGRTLKIFVKKKGDFMREYE